MNEDGFGPACAALATRIARCLQQQNSTTNLSEVAAIPADGTATDGSPRIRGLRLRWELSWEPAADCANALHMQQSPGRHPLFAEGYVLFRTLYNVPVLFVQFFDAEGSFVSDYDRIVAYVAHSTRLAVAPRPGIDRHVLSEELHPVHGTLCFAVQPCFSQSFIDEMVPPQSNEGGTHAVRQRQQQRSLQWLAAWLSVYSQPAGMRLPASLWVAE